MSRQNTVAQHVRYPAKPDTKHLETEAFIETAVIKVVVLMSMKGALDSQVSSEKVNFRKSIGMTGRGFVGNQNVGLLAM